MTTARAMATPCESPPNAGSISSAIAGSPRKPIPIEARVIPSWHADSASLMSSISATAAAAPESSSAAIASSLDFRARTSANSAATKNPFSRTRSPTAMSRSAVIAAILRGIGVEPTPIAVLPLIVGVFVLKGLLMQATYSYQAWLASRIPMKLRLEIVDNLQRVDYRTLDTTNTGFVSNLLVNEVARAQSGFTSFVRSFPPTLNILVFFTIVLWLDWKLTVACGAMALAAIALVGITGRIAARASRATTEENAILTSLLIQLVQAFKYLRATAGFGELSKKIAASADRAAKADYRTQAAAALSQSLAQPLMVVFLAGIIYYHSGVQ